SLVHISLVSPQLCQRIVGLDNIKCLHGFRSRFVRCFEQFFESCDSRGQRTFPYVANSLQVLFPLCWLGEFLEQHVSQTLSSHIGWIAHSSLTRKGEIAGLS